MPGSTVHCSVSHLGIHFFCFQSSPLNVILWELWLPFVEPQCPSFDSIYELLNCRDNLSPLLQRQKTFPVQRIIQWQRLPWSPQLSHHPKYSSPLLCSFNLMTIHLSVASALQACQNFRSWEILRLRQPSVSRVPRSGLSASESR